MRIKHEQKGRRALADEENLGRSLVKSLETTQLEAALISAKAPTEITTGNDRQVDHVKPTGLAYVDMTAGQQEQLRKLVGIYAGRLRAETAEIELGKISEAGWEQVHFAWAGGLEPGEGHYYRIQGPAFLIEYDNTQDRANHIHTVWRSFAGDFGRDLLGEHLQREHNPRR